MKLLFLFGDGAVGKMTVGQELCKVTPFRLFHNHMMIEPILEVFGDFHSGAIQKARDAVFTEFAKTDHYGLIFTFMWAFDQQADWDYVAHVRSLFPIPDEDVYYVELIAPLEIRLERNATENRLQNKASKRDIAASNQRVIDMSRTFRLVSEPGEIQFPNYFRLENAEIPAPEAANIIKTHFGFESEETP